MVSFEQLFEGREGESHLEMRLSVRGSDAPKTPAWASPMGSKICQEAGVPVSGQIQLMRPKRYRKGHFHPGYL